MELEKLINDDNILNIYLFGSTVYGTRNINSDNDYIIICKKLPETGTLENIGNNTFHYHTVGNFNQLLSLNEIQILECLFLPEKYILKRRIIFKTASYINKENLRRSVSTISSNSWVKGKKKLIIQGDYDKYLAIKSIFHSIRIIDFGIQIATHNEIIDYSSMNYIMFDLLKLSEDNESITLWEKINTKYLETFNSKKRLFKTLCPLNKDKTCIVDSEKLTLIINDKTFHTNDINELNLIQDILNEFDIIIKEK